MGLDIRVYTNLQFVTSNGDCEDDFEYDLDSGVYLEPLAPPGSPMDRSDGLKRGMYKATCGDAFRAGSYSGYNAWRNQLSLLMLGVPATVVWDNYDAYKDKPFWELIHYSDCEGFIGPQTSAKLAKDFEEHRDKLASADEDFIQRYEYWMNAFKAAAEHNGVVCFR